MNKTLSLLFLLSVIFAIVFAVCFETKECKPTSSFLNKTLPTCKEYCRKCRGLGEGSCRRGFSRDCTAGFECYCFGGQVQIGQTSRTLAACKL